jgi:HEAT repeat protein
MTRALPIVGCLVLIATVAAAQQPVVQNGKLEPRRVAALERDVMAIGGAATDPVWVGWRVPMVDGDRDVCSFWNTMRGDYLDSGISGTIYTREPRPFAPPSGPVPLEGGTGILVLMRFVDGRLERLRTLRDDCPIDAGGRTIHWLDGVTPADSLRFLDTLTRVDGPDSLKALATRRSVASSALSAIAYHRDAGADAILERLATDRSEASLRSTALSTLGRLRGARGLKALQAQLTTELTPEGRRQLITAIGQSREPGAMDTLRTLLRDTDAKVRAEAVARYGSLGGSAVANELLAIINSDPVDAVRMRATSALAGWPRGEGVPHLLTLARSSPHAGVRKEAAGALSRSSDPRAVAYMEELLKR